MTKIEIAKTAVKSAVGLSTSFVISGLIRNNVQPATTFQKVETEVGAFVLGYMVADFTEKYAVHKVEQFVAWWDENVKKTA